MGHATPPRHFGFLTRCQSIVNIIHSILLINSVFINLFVSKEYLLIFFKLIFLIYKYIFNTSKYYIIFILIVITCCKAFENISILIRIKTMIMSIMNIFISCILFYIKTILWAVFNVVSAGERYTGFSLPPTIV